MGKSWKSEKSTSKVYTQNDLGYRIMNILQNLFILTSSFVESESINFVMADDHNSFSSILATMSDPDNPTITPQDGDSIDISAQPTSNHRARQSYTGAKIMNFGPRWRDLRDTIWVNHQ